MSPDQDETSGNGTHKHESPWRYLESCNPARLRCPVWRVEVHGEAHSGAGRLRSYHHWQERLGLRMVQEAAAYNNKTG